VRQPAKAAQEAGKTRPEVASGRTAAREQEPRPEQVRTPEQAPEQQAKMPPELAAPVAAQEPTAAKQARELEQ
jgi:hypothetical protein